MGWVPPFHHFYSIKALAMAEKWRRWKKIREVNRRGVGVGNQLAGFLLVRKIWAPLDPKTMKNEGFTPPIYGL